MKSRAWGEPCCETDLNRITRKGLFEKATFEQKLEGGRADQESHRASLQIPGVGKFQANGRITNGLKKRVLFIVEAEVVRPQ